MIEITEMRRKNRKPESLSEQKQNVTLALRLQNLERATSAFNKAIIAREIAGRRFFEARETFENGALSGSVDGKKYSLLELELAFKKCENEYNLAEQNFQQVKINLDEASNILVGSIR